MEIKFIGRWLLLGSIIALFSGCASALFLLSLGWITTLRQQHLWLLAGLPLAGVLIAWLYQKLEHTGIGGGNILIFKQIEAPQKILIPWLMAPVVWVATLLTHLFGGSAGREGTAVQMAGALSDQLSRWINFSDQDRRLLLMCGVAAGFASVFGTPLAGAIFALEIGFSKNPVSFRYAWPVLWAALGADKICSLWPVHHTHYAAVTFPSFSIENLTYVVVAALAFGLAARVFVWLHSFIAQESKKLLPNSLTRAAAGGALVAVLLWLAGAEIYAGLGIEVIKQSFVVPLVCYTFALKLIFTCLTLGVGFKGGEVTPLFFVGATLGNALATFLPWPIQNLAALGFVSVFAAATKTPLAGLMLGIEVFGGGHEMIYWAIAPALASLVAGEHGIYTEKKST